MSFTWPTAQHIYLSPHLDDVVLSCGGLVFEQAHRGDTIAVITIFAASPSSPPPLSSYAQDLHLRWQASASSGVDFSDPPALRRAEDLRALAVLHPSIQAVHYTLPDCIYRTDPVTGQALYDSEEAIFGDVQPDDPAWDALQSAPVLREDATLYVPLAIGHHVDHQVLRYAAEGWKLAPPRVRYYEDYPYVSDSGALEAVIDNLTGWQSTMFALDEEAMAAKIRAVTEYASQISTFWADEEAMAAALKKQVQIRGERLWAKPDR